MCLLRACGRSRDNRVSVHTDSRSHIPEATNAGYGLMTTSNCSLKAAKPSDHFVSLKATLRASERTECDCRYGFGLNVVREVNLAQRRSTRQMRLSARPIDLKFIRILCESGVRGLVACGAMITRWKSMSTQRAVGVRRF